MLCIYTIFEWVMLFGASSLLFSFLPFELAVGFMCVIVAVLIVGVGSSRVELNTT